MDLNKIKTILNTNDSVIGISEKRAYVLSIIAMDVNAIPDILEILNYERSKKSELISTLNSLLSKADAALDSPKMNKDKFIQKEVEKFYIHNKDYVTHNWKKYDNGK